MGGNGMSQERNRVNYMGQKDGMGEEQGWRMV